MDQGKPPRRFTSAHAIALAALFFALGGGAYAVSTLPANSVGTKQLQRHSVTRSKLAQSARLQLTAKEKKELIKIVKKFSRRGPVGPQGPRGQAGEPGPSNVYIAGAAGGSLSGSYAVIASTSVPAGSYLIEGKTMVGGVSTSSTGAANCILANGIAFTEAWDGATAAFPPLPGTITAVTISLAGAASFDSPQTVALLCKSLEGTVSYDDARVWATRVGAVQGLPVPID
jgi:hypothetical protein